MSDEGFPDREQDLSGPDFSTLPQASEPPVRPIWRFVIAAVYVFAVDWVAGFVSYKTLPTHPLLEDALYRFIGLTMLAVGFTFMLRVFDCEDRPIPPALGFPRSKAGLDILIGAAIGFAMIAWAIAIVLIAGRYAFKITWTAATIRQLIEVSLLLLIGAAYEELGFRGYAFQRLVLAIGPIGAVAVFSAWFGAVHLANPSAGGILSWGFLNTILVGVLLAVAYLRTRALWMPIGIHFAWNYSLGVLFGLPVSGLNMFSVVVHGKALGSKLITGGSYGLEASITGSLVILAGFVPVIFLTRHRTSRI
jgi:membrane protease YdiL (CAAX protease family)